MGCTGTVSNTACVILSPWSFLLLPPLSSCPSSLALPHLSLALSLYVEVSRSLSHFISSRLFLFRLFFSVTFLSDAEGVILVSADSVLY